MVTVAPETGPLTAEPLIVVATVGVVLEVLPPPPPQATRMTAAALAVMAIRHFVRMRSSFKKEEK
jgi:hypothetical protein